MVAVCRRPGLEAYTSASHKDMVFEQMVSSSSDDTSSRRWRVASRGCSIDRMDLETDGSCRWELEQPLLLLLLH